MVKKLPSAISEEDFVKLIKNTKKEHHKLAFLLGWGAGLRISEVLNLRPEDINFKEKKIFIKQGKGGKDRIVPLPKGFKEKHLELLPFKFKSLKSGSRALEIAFKNAIRKAGLHEIKPDLHFHSLRHGFGSQLAKKGMPIHHIRTLMGHSNISTTNVYLELNPDEAIKKYEELF
ncbi:MAG: tyrosine-type recombinase/integrase [Candidatus Pacearchaeota archaeon]